MLWETVCHLSSSVKANGLILIDGRCLSQSKGNYEWFELVKHARFLNLFEGALPVVRKAYIFKSSSSTLLMVNPPMFLWMLSTAKNRKMLYCLCFHLTYHICCNLWILLYIDPLRKFIIKSVRCKWNIDSLKISKLPSEKKKNRYFFCLFIKQAVKADKLYPAEVFREDRPIQKVQAFKKS